ncbi:MAG: 6-phosphogluconolactonase [Fimbriimonadales bacterium]|nr:6-phosphogluconolactonase [Fimbriimonadales bacterium]
MSKQEEAERFRELLQVLESRPTARMLLRYILLYGRRHARGVVFRLDWGQVADALVDFCDAVLKEQPCCRIALSGGKTPEALYLLLATRHYQRALDWTRIHLFWGDERYVPHDDPRSNYGFAYENWLRKASIPPENIHPMPTHYADPDEAARAYEATLRAHFSDAEPFPRFELVFLGLGADGHVASLFAGDPALEESARWVMPSRAPSEPSQRLTLTLPVLNAASCIWFLVSSASKRPVIEQLFCVDPAPPLPAAQVCPGVSRFWWLSEELYAAIKDCLYELGSQMSYG